MPISHRRSKQNVTISLSQEVLRKAKILAAKHDTSISELLEQQIELLVGHEEVYERAEKEALGLLKRGFHLGGARRVIREKLHER